MPRIRLEDAGDDDVIFGKGKWHGRSYHRFRALMLQRKEQYRENTYIRTKIIEEIVEAAIAEGLKFFQELPGKEWAEELTKPQVNRKVRSSYQRMFHADQNKVTGNSAPQTSAHEQESVAQSPAPSQEQNRQSEYAVGHMEMESDNNPAALADSVQASLADSVQDDSGLATLDDIDYDGEFPLPVSAATTDLYTTFEGCVQYLNDSLTNFEKKQVDEIEGAKQHLQQCLQEYARVATVKAKLAHLSLHPERFSTASGDLLETIVQSIGEGGDVRIVTVAGDIQLQCGQTVSHPNVPQDSGIPENQAASASGSSVRMECSNRTLSQSLLDHSQQYASYMSQFQPGYPSDAMLYGSAEQSEQANRPTLDGLRKYIREQKTSHTPIDSLMQQQPLKTPEDERAPTLAEYRDEDSFAGNPVAMMKSEEKEDSAASDGIHNSGTSAGRGDGVNGSFQMPSSTATDALLAVAIKSELPLNDP